MRQLILPVLAAASLVADPAMAQTDNWMSRVDQERLSQGEMHLGLFVNDEQDGFMRLGWQRDGDQLNFFDRSMLASQEIYETMEGSMSAVDFSPQAINIRFHMGSAYRVFDTEFEPGRVTGSIDTVRPGHDTASMDVDMELPEGALARVTSFILMGVLPMQVGEQIAFDWYSSMSNAVAPITLSAVEEVTVDTPAGQFETVRVELRGGRPNNDIFVDVASGQVVRIDVIGQSMSFLALPAAG